jgi:hypothetical protein
MRALLLVPLAFGSLCDDPVPQAIAIPPEVHGTYGRDATDLELGTLGMEIDGEAIRFSEMTITVTDGKMVGDTFQISRAEVRWKKDEGEKLPKECKGTLARQGARLLLTLFKKDSDDACESVLKGDWTEWHTTAEFPEVIRGVYGSDDPYTTDEPVEVRATDVKLPYGEAPLVLKQAVQFADRETELIVREASVGGLACKGTLEVKDDVLSAALGDCPPLQGKRWKVGASAVPEGTMSNGRATVTFSRDGVTITSEGGTKCTQKILRTGQRPTTDAGRDRIPVPGGQVLLLSASAAEGGAACSARMKNLYQAECRERLGAPCPDDELPVTEVQCPTHLVVGDASTKGRKMALLPDDLATVACFDMTGDFLEK